MKRSQHVIHRIIDRLDTFCYTHLWVPVWVRVWVGRLWERTMRHKIAAVQRAADDE